MRSGRKTAAGERRKSSVQMVVDFVVGADASTRTGSTTMARRKSSRSGSVIFPSTSIGRKMSGLGASLTRRGSKEVVPDDTPQPPRNRRSSEQSMSLCHALYAYPMVPRLLLLLPPKTAGFSVLRMSGQPPCNIHQPPATRLPPPAASRQPPAATRAPSTNHVTPYSSHPHHAQASRQSGLTAR